MGSSLSHRFAPSSIYVEDNSNECVNRGKPSSKSRGSGPTGPTDSKRVKSTLKAAVGPVELSGDCLTAIHTPVPSCLPHRHYSEQGSDSGLDVYRVLDLVIDDLGRWTPSKA
ncbi:hypothetical protein CRG98_025993 [Punica granatum]|uniref:Uncharacterized protein n=1 Tax=Punica granatum TaxID=22663 RepID=A0A2I0JBL3_PUNGR|nr:hypothetical protein CRG98_025993 [Punica granatum]